MMAKANDKQQRDWRPMIINVTLILSILLLWQFVLVNRDLFKSVNNTIEETTGWDPDLKPLSLLNFPQPSRIFKRVVTTPSHGRGGPAFIWGHTSQTLGSAVVGFFLGNGVAIIIAVIFFYLPLMERAFMPFALAVKSIPLIAIMPLLLRVRFMLADAPFVQGSPILEPIFGTETFTKILIVVIIVFFPTLINVFQGLRSSEPAGLELMHSINASEWHIFWKLRAPSALPLTFSAFKMTASRSLIGVIVAEWLGGGSGLGWMMINANQSGLLKPADLWIGIVIVASAATGLFYLVSAVERIAIPWHESVTALKEAMEGKSLGLEEETPAHTGC